jgi:CheY-like chemotaxis protein
MQHRHLANARSRQKRVLVVEDDGWIRRVMRDLLSDEGYEVIEAADGRTAIRLVAEQCPDVMLLDVAMPDFSGADVLCELRSRRRTRTLPVVVVSAYPRVLTTISTESVSCVVMKPVHVDDLLMAVQRALAPEVEQTDSTPLEDDSEAEPAQLAGRLPV